MLSEHLFEFFTGAPDKLFNSIGNLIVHKNKERRESYLEKLKFYFQFQTSFPNRSLFYLPSRVPIVLARSTTPFLDGEEEIIEFDSSYEPQNSMVKEQFFQFHKNKKNYLRIFRHDPNKNRPLVICIHGFMLGNAHVAKRMFKISHLFNKGVDVALFCLPHHGDRVDRFFNQHLLCPHDIPLTLEGIAQTVYDLHSSILLLKSNGFQNVGLLGASLGGYSSIMYSIVSDNIDFIFTVVPAVNMNSYLRPKTKSFQNISKELEEMTDRALSLLWPIHYSPMLNPKKMGLVIHQNDQLNDATLTRLWAKQWGVEAVTEVPGGHWIYKEKNKRGKAFYSWLNEHRYI